jgi:REP element-mobilizing transposase RayT
VAFFEPRHRCHTAVEALKRVSGSMHFLIHAYCIMPDHAHMLAEGTTPGGNLARFVAQWKQSAGYLPREETSARFWQRRFYGRVLRKATASDAVAWYIWMNPVRKGIFFLGFVHSGVAEGSACGYGVATCMERRRKVALSAPLHFIG